MDTAPATPAISSETGALQMLKSALAYLATADPTQVPAAIQAQCLIVLEQADAMSTAARARYLAAFTAAQGYREDGDYSARSWLMNHTRVTKAAAGDKVSDEGFRPLPK